MMNALVRERCLEIICCRMLMPITVYDVSGRHNVHTA
jgi:hypothetical protein